MNPGAKLKEWSDKARQFYIDVRSEMKKVSWPGKQEVVSTTTIVILAVIFFGAYLGVVDVVLGASIGQLLRYFNVAG